MVVLKSFHDRSCSIKSSQNARSTNTIISESAIRVGGGSLLHTSQNKCHDHPANYQKDEWLCCRGHIFWLIWHLKVHCFAASLFGWCRTSVVWVVPQLVVLDRPRKVPGQKKVCLGGFRKRSHLQIHSCSAL